MQHELSFLAYHLFVCSALCSTVWSGGLTSVERNVLEKTAKTASKTIGHALPSLSLIYNIGLSKKAFNSWRWFSSSISPFWEKLFWKDSWDLNGSKEVYIFLRPFYCWIVTHFVLFCFLNWYWFKPLVFCAIIFVSIWWFIDMVCWMLSILFALLAHQSNVPTTFVVIAIVNLTSLNV